MKGKIYKLLCLLTAAVLMLTAFTACGGNDKPTEPESTTEATTKSEEELLNALIEKVVPASIKGDMYTVFENSFMDFDLAFEEKIEKKNLDRAAVYEQLSADMKTEITCYSDYLKKQAEIQEDALRIKYGEDYKVTFEVVDKDFTDEEETRKLIEKTLIELETGGLSSARYFNPSKVEKYCKVDLDYTVEGSLYKQSAAKIITLCLYDGEWLWGSVDFV